MIDGDGRLGRAGPITIAAHTSFCSSLSGISGVSTMPSRGASNSTSPWWNFSPTTRPVLSRSNDTASAPVITSGHRPSARGGFSADSNCDGMSSTSRRFRAEMVKTSFENVLKLAT